LSIPKEEPLSTRVMVDYVLASARGSMPGFAKKRKTDSIGNLFRKIYGRSLGKPVNFSWIDSDVAGCGRPTTQRSVLWLKKQGITAVLSLTESRLPSNWVENAGLDYKHIPVDNHEVPESKKVREAVDFLRDSVKKGKKAAVHCAAGQGRTGTILAAYLVSKGMKPADAIERVRKLRPDSIEKFQEKAVYDFYLTTFVPKQQ
jgi:atypical dual specificity phosphatase